MKLIPVENEEGLFRDVDSGAIINKNPTAYNEFKKSKIKSKAKQDIEKAKEVRINTLEQRVDSIDAKLNKILELLTNGNT